MAKYCSRGDDGVRSCNVIEDRDGTILTDYKKLIQARWKSYFEE